MPRRPARGFARLFLESLEDRCTPAAGGFDATFGVNGFIQHGIDIPNEVGEFAQAVKVGPGGKIYVAGSLTAHTAVDFYDQYDKLLIMRLNSDGSLDRDYASDGLALLDIDLDPGLNPHALSEIAVDGQGRVVVVGQLPSQTGGYDMAVVRVAANGTWDRDFGNDGKAIIWFDFNGGLDDYAEDVAIDSLGRIVVSGSATTATGTVAAVGRLTPAGDRDTTFGRPEKPGRQWVDYNGAAADGFQNWSGVAIDSANRIILGGSAPGASNENFAAARLTAAGKLDATFSGDGVTAVDFGQGTGYDRGSGVTLGPAGTIVLGGAILKSSNAIDEVWVFGAVRLRADGTPDPSFGTNGRAYDMEREFYTTDIGIDPAGRVMLFSGTKIIRLGTDGRYDTTYGTGGIATVYPVPGDGGGVGAGVAMTVAPQGNLLFVTYGGENGFGVARVIGNDPFPVGAVQTFTAASKTFQAAVSNKQTLLYRTGTTGAWVQVTGVSVKFFSVLVSGSNVDMIVHGTGNYLHARMFFVDSGYLLEFGDWIHFNFGGKAVTKYSTAINTSGRFQVFALTSNGVLYTSLQNDNEDNYLPPVAFAGSGHTDFKTQRRQDGRIAVFLVTAGGGVKRSLANGLSTDQFTAFPALSAPASGITVTKLSAISLTSGRITLTVIGSNGLTYRTTETAANSNAYSAWIVV